MDIEELERKWKNAASKDSSIVPDYGGFSIASIPSAIRSVLEGTAADSSLGKSIAERPGKRVLLVVLDGLGYYALKRQREKLPFFDNCIGRGELFPVTTVFPSTTSAAVTTLHTGKMPGEHGIIEWYLYLSEIGMMVESLPFTPRLPEDQSRFDEMHPSIRTLYDGRTVYSRLARRGMQSIVIQPEGIAHSQFSLLISRGAEIAGYSDLADATVRMGDVIKSAKYGLTHFYYPGIDSAGHAYGPSSHQYLEEMQKADSFLGKIAPMAEANDTTLIVTADHGQVDVNTREMPLLNSLDGFDSMLRFTEKGPVQPYGSPRDVIIRAGSDAEFFRDWLLARIGDIGEVKTSDELIHDGYFGGNLSTRARERISDLWILPRNNNVVWYRHYPEERVAMSGMHGGASPEEMIVPMLLR